MHKYITKEGKDVTEKIDLGMTKFFTNEPTAYRYAQKVRRYHYPLYKRDITGRQTFVGFAVPS
jgi:hypothetical protein